MEREPLSSDDRIRPNGEDNHPVRKMLRSLQRVKASQNFDQRLQRRIAGRRETDSIPSAVQPGWRPIPAFAYSAAAIVVVGVLAYSLLIRTGTSPTSPGPNVPVLHDSAAPQSAPPSEINPPEPLRQNSASPSKNNEGQRATQVGADKHVSPHEERSDDNADILPTHDRGDGQQNAHRATSMALKRVQPQSPMEMTQSKPGRDDATIPPAAVQDRMVIDRTKSTTGTLELNLSFDSTKPPADGRRVIEPRLKDALGVGVMNIPVTASLRDSVKADSLKKLQKQILQTKPKVKKPLD